MASPRTTERPGTTRAVAEVGIVVALLTGGAIWAAAALPGPARLEVRPPWWALAIAFTVAQSAVLNVQTGRQARSVSLTEIPFVMALLTLPVSQFLLMRLVCGALAQAVFRRQWRSPAKLVFNVLVVLAESGAGLLTFHALARHGAAQSVLTWTAGAVAAMVGSAAGAIAVDAVIGRIEGRLCWRQALAIGWLPLVLALGLAATGMVALLALEASSWSALPLLAVAVLVLFAYRGYADLLDRHGNVERLYAFSRTLGSGLSFELPVEVMLGQVLDLLQAERASLTFIEQGVPVAEMGLGRDQPLARSLPSLLADIGDDVLASLVAGESLLVRRDARGPAYDHWQSAHDLREAMLVPIRGEAGVAAVLAVIDRLGESRGFRPADLQLLEAVANHAAIAMRNAQLVRRLRHDSLHDALTGAPNRTHLQQEVEKRLDAGVQDLAVAMLDLDSFKDVNDTLGHDHGDELLREVSRRLVAAAPSLVCRFGGDEFALLLPDCATDDDAVRRCQVIVAALAEPVEVGGVFVDVSASIGIARAPAHASTWSDLMKRADQAMYVAKQGGRSIAVFESAHDTSSPSRLALVVALRRAIAHELIDVHVQPKVSLTTGRLVGVEALARWHDEERGQVAPEEFIGLAEKTGLIRPITELVLERSIRACAEWQADLPGVAIAVNVSFHSLRERELDEYIRTLLAAHALAPELLTIEITETSIMTDPAAMSAVLDRLRALGVRLSIDDFGTGYSSLSQLRRLPVQEVKVDRSFVLRMHEEADDAAIVRSIIELARTLDLEVVAEGVETASSLQLLRRMGCHVAQGYYVGRPMPVTELVAWSEASAAGVPAPRAQAAVGG